MKMIKPGTCITAICLLGVCALQTSAIEELKVSVQCPDVVLSWPSVDGETYIVQYRPDVTTNSAWTTLTNYFPAVSGTNLTVFVHSNALSCPAQGSGDGGGGTTGGPPSPDYATTSTSSGTGIDDAATAAVPMVMPKDNTKMLLPLVIYPPGLDLSGHIIIWPDGSTDEWSENVVAAYEVTREQEIDGPQPADSGGGDPSAGFYQVVRTVPHVFGLQDGAVLSGVYQLQAEFGNVDGGTLKEITVSDDGAAFEGADSIIPTNGTLPFILDTTRMSNGVHNLQLIAYMVPTNASPTPDGSDAFAVEAPPVSIVVSNEISFPYWEPLYFADWQVLYIQARSAHTNTDWQIDLYGDDSSYIGSFTGHSDDGLIAVAWNLVDPYGQVRTDAFFIPVITTPYSDPAGPKIWRGYDYFPSRGDWVVANQQAWQGWNNAEELDSMADSIAQGAQGAGFIVRPPGAGGQAFRLPVTDNNAVTNAWHTFYNAVTNFVSRNLFYFGHGHNSTLGGYTHPGDGYGLSATEIGYGLRNLPWYEGFFTSAPLANPQRYRFVFIDGCEGADGNLPFLFGVTNNRDPDLHPYQPGEMRPSAFMGFKGDVAVGVHNTGIYLYHPNYVSWFFYEWVGQGDRLADARTRAMNYSGTAGFPLSSLKIIGYDSLHYMEADFK